MNALVYSSSLTAAFLGGILALFAPCCVVSLLPMFVGAAMDRGRVRLPITAALFAAGVAVVLLPIVLGVGALGQVLMAHHRAVFFVIGLFLVSLGLYVFAGRPWTLPVPMLRVRTAGSGPGPVFLLGVASGISSACCAPVVAGVVAMSALAASVVGALGLGVAYVFGMVFPLLVAALLWDRARMGERMGVLQSLPRLRIRGWSLALSDGIGAGMFMAIGVLALGLAVTGQSTYTPNSLAAWNRWATSMTADAVAALRSIPVPVQAFVLAGIATWICAAVYIAWRRGPVPQMAHPDAFHEGPVMQQITVAEDPVCGMEVNERTAPAASRNAGRTYYFCSQGCKAAFDRDPAKFLSGRRG